MMLESLMTALLGGAIHLAVEPTRLIKRGDIFVSTSLVNSETVSVGIDYALIRSWIAPFPDQRGTLTQDLPASFVTEDGYRSLEAQGSMDYSDVKLSFLGRGTVNGYTDCYLIHVEKKSGAWDAVAAYHPSVPSTGWIRLAITYRNIPALGDYTINSNLVPNAWAKALSDRSEGPWDLAVRATGHRPMSDPTNQEHKVRMISDRRRY